jgi:4'-phosphopantetheinyl transferase
LDLDQQTDTASLADRAALLSADETTRWQRFRFAADRHLYLLSHVMLRRVLSCYADVAPAAWQFTHSAGGRPEIATGQTELPLRFNLTHTRGLAACVITQAVDCGVDAEVLTTRRHALGIAARMFAAEELAALHELQGQAFLHYFYSCWTLREAYCKGRGVGLAGCGKDFRFEQDPRAGWQLWRAQAGAVSDDWRLRVEQVTDSHLVAVAVNAPRCGFHFYDFTP